jgi:hypothetical protein
MFACYYLDARGIPRPAELMDAVATAAKAWQEEKDAEPDEVAALTLSDTTSPARAWVDPPPASLRAAEVTPLMRLSPADERMVASGAVWDISNRERWESLVLRMAVMHHLDEFGLAPLDLAAEAAASSLPPTGPQAT